MRATIPNGPIATAASAAAPMPGQLGRYEILKRLAVGGMAEIFLARLSGISGFERLVVVKRILPQLATNPEFVRMFFDEARIAATLHHSNIVQVFDVGTVDGQYFFAMEYLHGEDLSGIMRALLAAGRGLPLEAALVISLGVCAGLHYAHEMVGVDGEPLGIVHRDVSPQNVIVTFDGGVKLLDFGIAKASNRLAVTRCGTLKGKVRYMSPEQCQGGAMDRRADVFSLAILVWELTTGRRLFARSGEFETLKMIVETDAPPPSSVIPGYPPVLERIVMRGLRRRREERYQTAQEMQLELEDFARENKLSVSAIFLGRLMGELFGDRLKAWQAVKNEEFTIAEYLDTVMQRSEGEADDEVPLVDEATETAAPQVGPAAMRAPSMSPIVFGDTVSLGPSKKPAAPDPAAPRRTRAPVFVVIGVACGIAAALSLGGWLLTRPGAPAPLLRPAGETRGAPGPPALTRVASPPPASAPARADDQPRAAAAGRDPIPTSSVEPRRHKSGERGTVTGRKRAPPVRVDLDAPLPP